MLEQFCDDFLAVVPLQLPELLDKRKMEKPVKYDDYVLLTFQLNTPFTIEEVMDMLEDEMMMQPMRNAEQMMPTSLILFSKFLITIRYCLFEV